MTKTGRDVAVTDRLVSRFESVLDPRSDSCVRVPIIETAAIYKIIKQIVVVREFMRPLRRGRRIS
jgi:hypothetical protein